MLKLLVANLKIMFRDRISIFWALVFPLIFITVFALFNLDEPPEINIAVINRTPGAFSQALIESLRSLGTFEVTETSDEHGPYEYLRDGDYDRYGIIPNSSLQPGYSSG